jgi:hypothetical protein
MKKTMMTLAACFGVIVIPLLLPADVLARDRGAEDDIKAFRNMPSVTAPVQQAPARPAAPARFNPTSRPEVVKGTSDFQVLEEALGCRTKFSKDRAADQFAKIKGVVLAVAGEVSSVSGGTVMLKVLSHTLVSDLTVRLANAADGYNLLKGERITVRFRLTDHGGCFLNFGGDQGELIR